VNWEKPEWEKWRSALAFEDVSGLKVENFMGAPAKPQTGDPAVLLEKVEDATICNSRARPGTQVFLQVKGPTSNKIHLVGNELHDAAKPFEADADVKEGTVHAVNNY